MLLLPNVAYVPVSHAANYGHATLRRPIMDVELAAVAGDGRLIGHKTTVLLVDSGADVTILDPVFATILGIDLSAVTPTDSHGVGKSVVPTYSSPVQILVRLCDKWIPIPVNFIAGQQPGLLGREGAFDALNLAFLHAGTTMAASAV